MSLRHTFPHCDLPDLRCKSEPQAAPPVLRKPVDVPFRKKKPAEEVAAEINGFKYVSVVSQVAAGKSTSLPVAIQAAVGVPLLHVFPSELMAVDNYDYVSSLESGVDYELCLKPSDPISKSGITVTTYACVVARLLIGHASGNKSPLGDVLVYADEVAESDCYTYVVCTLGPTIPGIRAFVRATATAGADAFPMREDCSVTSQTFKPEFPETWDPYDEGKPWSASGLGENMLVFVDDEIAAENMVARYNASGCTSYRLSAKMDISIFRQAMKAWRSQSGGVVVLVADYSFRNGFNMDPAARIVDSGYARFFEVSDGSLKTRYRPIYKLEEYQTMGRSGRSPGCKVNYFRPAMNLKTSICVLEGVELEAAALLFKLLGYMPPLEIKSLALFSGSKNIPRDLVGALNGFVSLTMLPEAAMVPLVYEPPVKEPEIDASDVLSSYGDPDEPRYTDYFSEVENTGLEKPERVLDGLQLLAHLEEISSAAATLQWPNYYACHGVNIKDVKLRHYGADWERAMSDILRKETVVWSMDFSDKRDAIGLFLLRYNACVLEFAAGHRVVQSKRSLEAMTAQYPKIVQHWSSWLSSHVRDNEAMGKSLLCAIDKLREDSMYFTSVEPDVDLEEERAKVMASKLINIVQSARSEVDPKSVFNAVGRLVSGESFYPGETSFIKATAEISTGRDSLTVTVKPVHEGKRRMNDLVIEADQSVVWNEQDYITAVSQVMLEAGLSVSTVRKVKLGDSRVNPGRVMQAIRDKGEHKRRAERRYSIKLLKPA